MLREDEHFESKIVHDFLACPRGSKYIKAAKHASLQLWDMVCKTYRLVGIQSICYAKILHQFYRKECSKFLINLPTYMEL